MSWMRICVCRIRFWGRLSVLRWIGWRGFGLLMPLSFSLRLLLAGVGSRMTGYRLVVVVLGRVWWEIVDLMGENFLKIVVNAIRLET